MRKISYNICGWTILAQPNKAFKQNLKQAYINWFIISVNQTTLLDNRFSILHIERTNNFSKVFFALDTYQNPPRNCAIKVYKPIAQKPQLQEWIVREFQKEAARLKQLSLTNEYLPEIYTYFHDSQAYYIARELVEGATFEEKVQDRGVFSCSMVREILRKLLLMLDNLHRTKVVHQNIKPKNIIERDSDRAPISINFGGLEQIVATFDFHGDKNIFSLNDTLGYAPSEQALGKANPTSDLYSLGLTAIYLLTAKNPKDLSIDLDSGNYLIPPKIKARDPELAATIARAVHLNPSDRYSSASEMLDALLMNNNQVFSNSPPTILIENNGTYKTHTATNGKTFLRSDRPLVHSESAKYSSPISQGETTIVQHQSNKSEKDDKQQSDFDWKLILFLTITGLYISYVSMTALYSWKSVRETSMVSESTNSLMLPSTSSELIPEISLETEQLERRPSLLDNESSNLIEIPIFPIGTNKQELRATLGEPNAIQEGYWSNSIAWIYKGRAKGQIDLGYLFDLDTNELQQTEVAIARNVSLETIQEIMNSLLQGKTTKAIERELGNIYYRRTNTYLFKSKELEGTIERDKDDKIYIGIWNADFH